MSDDRRVRINKYLAQAGVCSRRDADKLIEEGKVTIGQRRAMVGDTVGKSDTVYVNGRVIGENLQKLVYAFYKPVGVTCTEKDRFAKWTIKDCVNAALPVDVRLTYAGRLDKESEGLLLLTNDGDLIHALMRGENRHEKEYIVKINKEVTNEFITGMSSGVFLKELAQTTRACKVEKMGKYTFRIILTQGLNRQIRRMCEVFGCRAVGLKRVRVGNILLGRLSPGQLRQITGGELEQLYELAGMSQETS